MALKHQWRFETTFATYTGIDIIGQGGAGRIFKVVDNSAATFALKLLNLEEATTERRKRFKNEVLFCARNTHPNIVTVLDHGLYGSEATAAPFCVMPLFAGSLRKIMKRRIPAEKILPYFVQILDGVEAAHLLKVVHRDLKPENILFDHANDRLLVADFGIAEFHQEDLYTAVETRDCERLANFVYAAPEQRERGTPVDAKADIYALGKMLNEMYTGTVPDGTAFPSIREVSPNHAYLDDLVDRMLRSSPHERPATIEAVKQELRSRGNEFAASQKVSQLRQTVIPESDIDDPFIADPPRVVDFDWHPNELTLVLSRLVNERWKWALQHMGNYSFINGKRPEAFRVSGDRASIGAQERDVQPVIECFKAWLPNVITAYEQNLREEMRRDREKRHEALAKERQAAEARERVLKSVRI